MDLIVNQMVELKVVHISDSNGVIELFTCTSVIENGLTVFSHAGFLEHFADIIFVCTVEYGSHYLPAKLLCSHTEMNLKHLTDVHT